MYHEKYTNDETVIWHFTFRIELAFREYNRRLEVINNFKNFIIYKFYCLTWKDCNNSSNTIFVISVLFEAKFKVYKTFFSKTKIVRL